MRKLILIAAIVSLPAIADTYVRGYVRPDGTYVQPHYQSSPNQTKTDNYSSQGNINPYTGQRGTVDPYRNDPPKLYNPPAYTPPSYNTYSPPKAYEPYKPPKY